MMKTGVGADDSVRPENNNILDTNEINTIDSTITNEIQTNEALIVENTNSMQEQNIGGENVEIIEETQVEPEIIVEQLSQMEQDAKDIIATKSLTLPLKGTITSRFGIRESTNPIVPKNHTGIDIAANEGTVFIAAMAGVVEEVSSEGDLGNHFSIVSDDVATVYAHCSKIYVKEGDKISQGQKIGEVGSTGNSTGPHLHFEIKKDNRYVDPDLILEF